MNHYPQTIQQLKDYRDYPALSQSQLKLILANNTKPFKETIPMLIGSYLDCILTSPVLTDQLFQVGLNKRPSDAIKGFIDELWEQAEQTILNDLSEVNWQINKDLEVWKEPLMIKVRKANYQPKWGDDAVWKSIIKDGQDYWEELINSQGKKIITQEERILCDKICSLMFDSSITGKYFQDHLKIDKYFQKELYWISEKEPCKGLLDLLIIEHETKTIYIIDIKTTSIVGLEEWFSVCRQKGYNCQLSFYKEGVEQNYSNLIEQGYKIECRWLVVPLNVERFKPWIIPCTEYMLLCGKQGYSKFTNQYYTFGREIKTGQKEYKGWVEAIKIYKRAKSEGLLDYDLTWFDYQGKLPGSIGDKIFFN